MCGYIGQVSFNKINNNLIEKCNENIICRGPDEKIVYTNKNTKLKQSSEELNFSFYFQ